MKQQLVVDAYVTKGLPKLDAFVRDLRDLLQEYKNASAAKFDYTIIEAKDEDTKKKAKDAGLIEQPFGEASDTDEKAAVTQGFMGLIFKYGEQQDVIKFLPPDRTDGLELLGDGGVIAELTKKFHARMPSSTKKAKPSVRTRRMNVKATV